MPSRCMSIVVARTVHDMARTRLTLALPLYVIVTRQGRHEMARTRLTLALPLYVIVTTTEQMCQSVHAHICPQHLKHMSLLHEGRRTLGLPTRSSTSGALHNFVHSLAAVQLVVSSRHFSPVAAADACGARASPGTYK